MSIDFSFNDAVVKLDHVLVKQVGDTAVLLNLKNEAYYGLDAVGYDFFMRLTASENIASAYQELLQEYDADAETLQNDLRALINNLLESEIVTINVL